jgi:hypothetical protein
MNTLNGSTKGVTVIKLQPGLHCNGCRNFDNERLVCPILKRKVKIDYHSPYSEPAMPLGVCPLGELVIVTPATGHVYTNPIIMGIFDEHEYAQWLDQKRQR